MEAVTRPVTFVEEPMISTGEIKLTFKQDPRLRRDLTGN